MCCARDAARRAKRQAEAASQGGSVLVMAAAGILFILGMVGLAVDLGHLYAVHNELRRGADAGAMAGVRSLFPYPLSSAALPLTPNCAAALDQARSIALANLVEGAAPTVANLQTGSWDWTNSQFNAGCLTSPFTNAVTITLRRDNIEMTVMGALGFGPVSLQTTATAVMDWVGKLEQGVPFVLAVDKTVAQSGEIYIYLSPSPIKTGSWYTKAPQNPDNSTVKNYLDYPSTIPALKQGDLVNVNNGDWGDVLHILNSSWIDKSVWVPVVNDITQGGSVIGFTSLTIREVGTTGGNKYIRATANPIDDVPESEAGPGGGQFGLLAAPRLVQ